MPLSVASTPDPAGSPQPPSAALADYASLDCSLASNDTERPTADVADHFLNTCGNPDGSPTWYKFLLNPATVSTADLADVHAEADGPSDGNWAVSIDLNGAAAKRWATFTGSQVGATMALVINGRVFSVETIEGRITGPTQIAFQLSASDAKALAKALAAALAVDHS